MYQVPGGMLSNLVSQLKQANQSDKLQQVLEEVPRVRADAGYPPLVTPSSQIVGTQAVFNVLFGERYKSVTKESRALSAAITVKRPSRLIRLLLRRSLATSRRSRAVPPTRSSLRWMRCARR